MLTPVAIVSILAEKVNECPLNWGHYVLFGYKWEYIIWSSRVSTIQGFLILWRNGRISELSAILLLVSAVEECPVK